MQPVVLGRDYRCMHNEWFLPNASAFSFNLAAELPAAAVAYPRDVGEVAAAVHHAREHGLRVAPQATGHNVTAYGSLKDAVLVDVRRLQDVSIDASARRVRVGAGVKWERLGPRLSELGLAGLHGSSPDVGVAGYSLGGGMGWLARKYGLQANSVTAIELVLADGRHVRADATHEVDLFWALRGGNGNFGVVTAIEFAVYPVEELYAGVMFFPFARSSDVLHTWARMLPSLPEELMTWASLLHFPDAPFVPQHARGGSFAVVYGAFLGDERDGRELLEPVRALGPAVDTFAMVPPAALGDLAMDPPEPLPYHTAHQMLTDLPPEAVDAILAAAGPGTGAPIAMVQLRHLGGALARVSPSAGARATLPGEVSLLGLGVIPDEASAAPVRSSLAGLEHAVLPYRAGDYPNFVEEPVDTARFFDAETWTRLRDIKASYDPTDLFRGNHRIPPAEADQTRLAA
jgi:FAD/FMN-containing dehydrogenase